jgi:hypothetical protein
VREGRKVVKVRFSLKERAKKTRLGSKKMAQLSEATSVDELKTKLLQAFHLSKEQIEQILSDYESQFIQDKIAIIEDSKPFQEGKVQNLPGYLLSALKNNYQPAKNKQVVNIQDAKLELEMSELKRQVELIKADYQVYREKMINKRIQSLEQNEKKKFLEEFYQFAEPVVKTILQLQRKYTRETVLDSPQVKALLRQFALREIDMLNVPSLEEFVAELDEQQIEMWHKLKSFDPDHPLLKFSE